MAFVLMAVVLAASAHARWMRFTGLCAGALVALFITAAAPVSGMSINPARTLASAVAGGVWTDAWIYALAPPLGMLLAAEAQRRLGLRTACAKLDHDPRQPCIHCGHPGTRPHPMEEIHVH